MRPVLRKSWQRTTLLLLLGAAVAGVAIMAINDSNPNYEKAVPEPASRTITEFTAPDLSLAGFRIGSLAVFLVDNLFSGTQSLLNTATLDAASTVTTVATPTESFQPIETSMITSTTSRPSTSRPAAPSTTTRKVEVPSSSSIPPTTQTPVVITTTTTIPASTTVAETLPVSTEPSDESLEPSGDVIIFGQPYLDTWPTLEMWERMAWCESRKTWDVDTGNGYFGGLQFALGSWQWMGGEGSPADASKDEQIFRANLLWQAQGWNGWPGCKEYFGWSRWQVSE